VWLAHQLLPVNAAANEDVAVQDCRNPQFCGEIWNIEQVMLHPYAAPRNDWVFSQNLILVPFYQMPTLADTHFPHAFSHAKVPAHRFVVSRSRELPINLDFTRAGNALKPVDADRVSVRGC
jgi:hypothetical protein